jgi:hypothetical protein
MINVLLAINLNAVGLQAGQLILSILVVMHELGISFLQDLQMQG